MMMSNMEFRKVDWKETPTRSSLEELGGFVACDSVRYLSRFGRYSGEPGAETNHDIVHPCRPPTDIHTIPHSVVQLRATPTERLPRENLTPL